MSVARVTGLPSAGTAPSPVLSSQSVVLPMHGEDHDRGDDLRRLAELLAVDQQIAEPFGGAEELGRDHEHPAEPEPGAQRDHIGRQHGGQQDAPHHRVPERRKTRPTSTILRSTESIAPITPR